MLVLLLCMIPEGSCIIFIMCAYVSHACQVHKYNSKTVYWGSKASLILISTTDPTCVYIILSKTR